MARRGGTEADRRERGDETRRRLVEAGRELFVDPGYFHTSVSDVVSRSGVGTRGAFYHHFADKQQLFRVVFEEVERDLVTRMAALSPPVASAWDRLVTGMHRFLDAATEPEVQRVMLIDGPAVLGWEARRTIEEANSIALIEAIVRTAMDDGTIRRQPVGVLAHVLSAAVEEAAMLVAHAEDGEATRPEAVAVVDGVLSGFLASGPVDGVASG